MPLNLLLCEFRVKNLIWMFNYRDAFKSFPTLSQNCTLLWHCDAWSRKPSIYFNLRQQQRLRSIGVCSLVFIDDAADFHSKSHLDMYQRMWMLAHFVSLCAWILAWIFVALRHTSMHCNDCHDSFFILNTAFAYVYRCVCVDGIALLIHTNSHIAFAIITNFLQRVKVFVRFILILF